MKKISVSVTVYNEQGSIKELCERLTNVFAQKLPLYDYEIIFIDNNSTDGSQKAIEEEAAKDTRIKAILNAGNYGQGRSNFHGIITTSGDCVVSMAGDLQDPPEMIPEMVERWEAGHRVVAGVKTSSKENKLMYGLRHLYYSFMEKFADIHHIPHFTLFGLYDAVFVDMLRNLNDPNPYLKGLVAEYGGNIALVEYEQDKRKSGKSSYNFLRLYDIAMLSITSCTRSVVRFATIFSFLGALLAFLFGIFLFIYKLLTPEAFLGTASVIVVISFIGALQLAFIGLIAEYIMNINSKQIKKPLVMEERRINFDVKHDEKNDAV